MEDLTRRRVIGGAVAAGAVAATGVAVDGAAAATRGRKPYRLDVAITAVDSVRQPDTGKAAPTGPYFASGDIYKGGTLKADGSVPAGAKKIGTYMCHGWFYSADTGANLATQTFLVNGRGEIDLVGREPGRAAVAGGTGDFRNVRGEGMTDDLGPTGLRAVFHLIG